MAAPAVSALDGSRNVAAVRKVNRLLDISVNEQFRDLVNYAQDELPVDALLASGEAAGPTASASQPQQLLVSTQLRSTLEERVMMLHAHFLREFRGTYDAFMETKRHIDELDQLSADLDQQLQRQSGAGRGLMSTVATLQTELALIREREEEVKRFKEKYQFTREEQRTLEEGHVDNKYLDLLDKARAMHLKCRELVMKGAAAGIGAGDGAAGADAASQQQQSAAQVMESSYITLLKASERITKHVLAMASSAMSPDVPEVSQHFLRCVQALRRDNAAQWQLCMQEIVRIRKTSVLRRYFHLMTNGSPLVASGTYVDHRGRAAAVSGGMRPLEAELDDPVYFFSSLFAWLHQSIAEEDDLISSFMPVGGAPHGAHSQATSSASSSIRSVLWDEAAAVGDAERTTAGPPPPAAPAECRRDFLDELFEGLVKHVRGMIDGVLDRLRQTTMATFHARQASSTTVLSTLTSTRELLAGEGGASRHGSGATSLGGRLGQKLVGGIGRFFAGGPTLSGFGSRLDAGRDAHDWGASTSAVGRQSVSPALVALSSAMLTCFQVEGLFAFYGDNTFTPLLGPTAALTRLVTGNGKLEVLRFFYDFVKHFSMQMLATTGEVVASQVTLLDAVRESSKFAPVAHLAHAVLLSQDGAGDEDARAWPATPPAGAGGSARRENLSVALAALVPGSESTPLIATRLAQFLKATVLVTPPEFLEALRVLRIMVAEIEKTAPMQRTSPAPAAGQPKHDQLQKREENLLPFVNVLLSFRQFLQQQQRITAHLDTASQLVLRLNASSALQEVVRSSVYTVSHVEPVQAEMDRDASLLVGLVSSVLCWHYRFLSEDVVRGDLLAPLSDAVHVAAAANALQAASTVPSPAAVDQRLFVTLVEKALQSTSNACGPSEARACLGILQEFYSTVGVAGTLYVPLLDAIESARLRERLGNGVTQNICRVYDILYGSIAHKEGVAPEALNQLAPQKLRILLDVPTSTT